MLHLQYVSPVELQIDSLVVDLFRTISEGGVRRLVVDSLDELALASPDRQRFHDYLYTMVQHMAVRGITSLMTLDASADPSRPHPDHRLSSVADAILALDVDFAQEPPQRRIRIVKARGTAHPLPPVPMKIGPAGIEIETEGERS